jgi:hypothetical protein
MKTKYASNSPELEQLLQTNTRMAKIQRNTIPVIESLPGFVSRFDGVDSARDGTRGTAGVPATRTRCAWSR